MEKVERVTKTVNLKLSEEFKWKLKEAATKNKMTLKEYVYNILKRAIEE